MLGVVRTKRRRSTKRKSVYTLYIAQQTMEAWYVGALAPADGHQILCCIFVSYVMAVHIEHTSATTTTTIHTHTSTEEVSLVACQLALIMLFICGRRRGRCAKCMVVDGVFTIPLEKAQRTTIYTFWRIRGHLKWWNTGNRELNTMHC